MQFQELFEKLEKAYKKRSLIETGAPIATYGGGPAFIVKNFGPYNTKKIEDKEEIISKENNDV